MHYMVYDNAGRTADRYTVIPRSRDWDVHAIADSVCRYTRPCLSLSDTPAPWHPQGVSQMGTAVAGRHLGKRIPFTNLPKALRDHVTDRLG